MASALEKLEQSTTPVKNATQATAPMYIVNPFRNKINVDDFRPARTRRLRNVSASCARWPAALLTLTTTQLTVR